MHFWDNFWPGFAATVAGVVLGIPAAMWLERLIEARSERKAEANDIRRLKSAVAVVGASLAMNNAALRLVHAALSKGEVPLAPRFDSATWPVMYGELRSLPNVLLLGELAVLFGRLEEIRRLLIVYEQQFFTTQASMSNAALLRAQLVQLLIPMCKGAWEQIERLAGQLQQV